MLEFVYRSLEAIGYYHPIHPTEVHMPIGLIVGGLGFSLTALLFRRPALAQAARYCFVLAFLFMFPTLIFGIMDWQHYYNGSWLHPIKMKIVLSGVLMLLLSWSVFINRKGVARQAFIIPVYALSFLMVVGLGYYGGELVLGGRATNISRAFGEAGAIFEVNCVNCHPNGRSATNPKLALRNTPQLATFEAFINHVRKPTQLNGSPGDMPPIPEEVLSDEEVWQLYQYIVHVAGVPPTDRKQHGPSH